MTRETHPTTETDRGYPRRWYAGVTEPSAGQQMAIDDLKLGIGRIIDRYPNHQAICQRLDAIDDTDCPELTWYKQAARRVCLETAAAYLLSALQIDRIRQLRRAKELDRNPPTGPYPARDRFVFGTGGEG